MARKGIQMKRILLIAMLLVLAACGNEEVPEPEPTPVVTPTPTPEYTPEPIDEEVAEEEPELNVFERAIEHGLVVSGRTPQRPTEYIQTYFEHLPFFYDHEIIHMTLGSENGLIGIAMYAVGEVVYFGTYYDEIYALLQTNYGEIYLRFLHDDSYQFSSLYDWELLELGSEYGVYFVYVGFDLHLEIPSGIFLNIYVPIQEIEEKPEEPVYVPTPRGINAAVYAIIRNGMSIDEVQELIGVQPSSVTESEFMGTTSTIKVWMDAQFRSITVMFTNGRVTSKSQMGL